MKPLWIFVTPQSTEAKAIEKEIVELGHHPVCMHPLDGKIEELRLDALHKSDVLLLVDGFSSDGFSLKAADFARQNGIHTSLSWGALRDYLWGAANGKCKLVKECPRDCSRLPRCVRDELCVYAKPMHEEPTMLDLQLLYFETMQRAFNEYFCNFFPIGRPFAEVFCPPKQPLTVIPFSRDEKILQQNILRGMREITERLREKLGGSDANETTPPDGMPADSAAT
ncbi:MAG: hypothetical protein ACPGXK_00040 [Phycisphaerae bacterium]